MPKRVHHNGKTAKCLFIVFLKVYSDVSIVNITTVRTRGGRFQ